MTDPKHISEAIPTPTRAKSALEHHASAVCTDSETLLRSLRRAGWTPPKFHEAVRTPGWWPRLQTEAFEAELEERVSVVGPQWFNELTDDQALGLIKHPELRRFATEYSGNKGALISGEDTEIFKTTAACTALRRLQRARERKRMETSNWLAERYNPTHQWHRPESRIRGGFVTAGDLLTITRCHKLGEEEPRDLRLAKTLPLLIIDDVSTPHARTEVTWSIIEARCNNNVPTVVTSGWPLPKLYTEFGTAGVRRMLRLRGEKGVLVHVPKGTR